MVNDKPNKRIPTTLYLTKDTIVFDFELDELTFISDTILKDDLNIHAKEIDRKFWSIYKGLWVFSDSVKNDSMRKNIYPNVRLKTLALLKNELGQKKVFSN